MKTNYKILPRSLPEKIICFFIFLMSGFCIESMLLWIFSYCNWNYFINIKGLISRNLYTAFYTVYFIFSAITIWSVWKNYSFKKLKLDISLFLIIFFLSIIWNYIFLIQQDFFISLICNLFILFFSIALTLLVWKKEKLSAILFLFCVFWTSYLFVVNMSCSITNC